MVLLRIMLILFGRGRNFSGMEFHVFRPIMTTFFLSVTKIWSFIKHSHILNYQDGKVKYCGFIRIHFIGHLPACGPKHLVGNLIGILDHTCTFLSNKNWNQILHDYTVTASFQSKDCWGKKLAISFKYLSPPQFCYFSNHGNLLLWLFYFGFGKIK